MKKITVCNILLNIIGVIAFFTALFIWFWMGTVGLYISLYNYDMNKEIGPFFMLGIGFIVGVIVIIIGIGIFRRKRWSRKALLIFWLLSSIFIIGFILLNIGDAFSRVPGAFEMWLGEVIVWLSIAAVGIAHAAFLNSSTVKELFNNK